MSNQDLIDEAIARIREICHRHGVNQLTLQHLERAGAHLREAWLVEDGQRARPVLALVDDCAKADRLLARLAAKRDVSGFETLSAPK